MGGSQSQENNGSNNPPNRPVVNNSEEKEQVGQNQLQKKFVFSQTGQLLSDAEIANLSQGSNGKNPSQFNPPYQDPIKQKQDQINQLRQAQAQKILMPMARDEQNGQNKPNKLEFGKVVAQNGNLNQSNLNASQSYLMNSQSYSKKLNGNTTRQQIFYQNSTCKQNPYESANFIQQIPPQQTLQQQYINTNNILKQSKMQSVQATQNTLPNSSIINTTNNNNNNNNIANVQSIIINSGQQTRTPHKIFAN
eukprot:TRINITY_DN4280_c0_g1_i3.p1 TRINITY_DN4280_c0_g1~~TRINITY_DN4280_c0_g1_i3.p1  ORF type:complete len:250 (-),score=51.83 TRINITY_DN4280_c0_g1_i3:225-974(-)